MADIINDKTRPIHSQFEKKLLIRSSTTTSCIADLKTEKPSTLLRSSASFCQENRGAVNENCCETVEDTINDATKQSAFELFQFSRKRQLSDKNEINDSKYVKNKNDWTRAKDDNDTSYKSCDENKQETKKKNSSQFFLGENVAFEKPILRNSFSHTATQDHFCINNDQQLQFTSLSTSSATVAQRPQSLPLTTPILSNEIPTMLLCEQPSTLSPFSSVGSHYRAPIEQSTPKKVQSKDQVKFLTSVQLSNYLKSSIEFALIDCGSPFRHTETHINKSILLHVADKISRKRLTTRGLSKYLDTTQMKLIDDSEFIVLYDDNVTISNIKNSSCPNLTTTQKISSTLLNITDEHHLSLSCSSLIVNDEEEDIISSSQLTPSLKCVYDEIKRYNTSKSVFILNKPFDEFYHEYSNLCNDQQNLSLPSLSEQQLNQQQPSRSDIENCLLTEIIPGLYLGNEADAKNYDLLEKNNIKSIINVTTCVPCYFESELDYLRLPCNDTSGQNLTEYFNENTFQFIKNSLDNKKNVLIHCKAGISRSPAILIAYLMNYHHSEFRTMNDAYNHVKQKRSIVSPNLNFMGQLIQFEKKLLTPTITNEL
ncbi:unnamed protein product [Didymodactylos carnosus]|uniref:protein-tyrosine-phosphatase n=1 Tax=Didymodactylos carnosus TaxID=1234261 RepID=A0A813YHX2_9BILA|nr:unnamed protein product [Didymodactylos carnosus]CAF0982364.1 unnamed protein product [Didymodactylos carnosus]CAF3669979.1 unnamed protein product [Didymodactylos carnosus]CAF3752885.1 unnamed protein product [Didymodactylos carnosus]